MADVASHHYWFLPVRRLLWDRVRLARLPPPRALPAAGHRRDGRPRDPVRAEPAALRCGEWAEIVSQVPGADHNDADLASGSTVIAMPPRN